jgi:hypothetical protein
MHYFQRLKSNNKISSEKPQTLKSDRKNCLLNVFNFVFKDFNILYARLDCQLQPDNGEAC